MNKLKNGREGFTLLELLVVVLIIGILAAIALPQYQMAVGKAKFATLKNNARVIKEALDRYYLVHNKFTKNLEALDIELSGTMSNNNRSINLTDGSSCYMNDYTTICRNQIFGVKMEYGIGYSISGKFCFCYSKDLTDKPNRLCQKETNKNTPTYPYDTYNMYRY